MEHKQILELIPAFALRVLDPDDSQQVEAHIVHCVDCRQELHANQVVLGELILAVPEREPPTTLKQRIMEKVIPPPKGELAYRPSTRQTVIAWFSRLAPAWSMVSLVLVLILAVSNLWLARRVASLESDRSYRVVELAGVGSTPEASGLLVVSSDGMRGTLVVKDLPELDAASQYQLWLIHDGVRTSGAVFSVDNNGGAKINLSVATSLLGFNAFGITIEPFGGSPGPTGEKVLGGDM